MVKQTSCEACAAGKRRDTSVADTEAETLACKACITGKYQDQVAQTSCEACAAGKHRNTSVDAWEAEEDELSPAADEMEGLIPDNEEM